MKYKIQNIILGNTYIYEHPDMFPGTEFQGANEYRVDFS